MEPESEADQAAIEASMEHAAIAVREGIGKAFATLHGWASLLDGRGPQRGREPGETHEERRAGGNQRRQGVELEADSAAG